tara:strand:+ start:5475 stop:5804 length:330 start_codon:yes stop_codon:yes gene_type:complete
MDKKDYEAAREDKFRSDSKDRLSSIIRKKIQTTMIGSLSSIEEHFGFLWAEEGPYDEDQKRAMLDIFNKVRSEILDKGNGQARNVDAELAQYDVKWLRYTMTIPVIPKD